MKKFIRKLQKMSRHSYSIVVPKELIDSFGWKERQKLVLSRRSKRHILTVKDWQAKK